MKKLVFLILVFIAGYIVGLNYNILPDKNNNSENTNIINNTLNDLQAKIDTYEQKWQEDWQTDIVALKDNSNIDGKVNGGIFVTSGYIKESLYYYCMENTEQGKHMIKIPADKTYIIETNDIKPSVVKQINKYVDKRQYFWLLVTDEEKYIIYVPENTIDTTKCLFGRK
jgi:hypothetical protein